MTNEELIAQIQSGEDPAENLGRLWEQNRGAVWQLARRYAGLADMEDLMQEGYLALHKAAHEYDPAKGASFYTMLLIILPRALYRYVGRQAGLQIPEHERRSIGELDRLEKRFLTEGGRYPTNQEACRELQISQEKLERIRLARSISKQDSLDRSIGLDDDDVRLMDIVAAPGSELEDVEERLYQEKMSADLWGAVDALEPVQGEVIRYRYKENLSRREISEIYNMSVDWPRTVEETALQKLRRGDSRRILLPYCEDRLYNDALHGTSMAHFKRTWTSSTEREALNNIAKSNRRCNCSVIEWKRMEEGDYGEKQGD